jgi:hypothetical protein
MGLFASFQKRRRWRKTLEAATPLTNACIAILDFAFSLADEGVRNELTVWDLEDLALQKCLGYITGVVDAGHQTFISNKDEYSERTVELVVIRMIARYISWVEDAERTVDFATDFIIENETASIFIGGLQSAPGFFQAMQIGGNDWIAAASRKASPVGLALLFGAKA